MTNATDFWRHMARLHEAYHDSGLTAGERLASIMQGFDLLPPTTQREVLVALKSLSNNLADVFTVAYNAANAQERRPQTG